jgi:copper chaperone CopZ
MQIDPEVPMPERKTYQVPDISSGHCRAAITEHVSKVAGVETVVVDLDAKLVAVLGTALDDTAICRAIYDAGYTASLTKETSR